MIRGSCQVLILWVRRHMAHLNARINHTIRHCLGLHWHVTPVPFASYLRVNVKLIPLAAHASSDLAPPCWV